MLNLVHVSHSPDHDVFAINSQTKKSQSAEATNTFLAKLAMQGTNNVYTQFDAEIIAIVPDDIFSLLN